MKTAPQKPPSERNGEDHRTDVVKAFVRRTRAASGVPERIEDEAAIGTVAKLLGGAT